MKLLTRWTHFAADGTQFGRPSDHEFPDAPTSQEALMEELHRTRRCLEGDHLAVLVEFPDDPGRLPCLLPAQPTVTRRVRVDLSIEGYYFERFLIEIDAHPRETPATLREAIHERLMEVKYRRSYATSASPDPEIQVADALRAEFPGRAWEARLHPMIGYAACPTRTTVVLRCEGIRNCPPRIG